jgi:MFS family permease
MFSGAGLTFFTLEVLKERGEESPGIVYLVQPLGKICAIVVLCARFGAHRHRVIDVFSRVVVMRFAFGGLAVGVVSLAFVSGTTALCAVSFLAMMCEEVCWGVVAVYVVESFPTSVRSSATGVLLFFAHIGGVVSLSSGEYLMRGWSSLPFLVMGILDVVGFVACLMLPSEAHGEAEEDLADTLPAQGQSASYGSTTKDVTVVEGGRLRQRARNRL